MSRTNEQDSQPPLSEHEVERYMTAFRVGLHAMDASPAEASRIRRLADKTDAQDPAPHGQPDQPTRKDLATLLSEPPGDLEASSQLERETSIRITERLHPQPHLGHPIPLPPPLPHEEADPVRDHPAVVAMQAQLERERARGEADLIIRQGESEAGYLVRQATLEAELMRRGAELDIREASLIEKQESLAEANLKKQPAASTGILQRPRGVSRRTHASLAIAAIAILASEVWLGSPVPLASVILASAAAALVVTYSVAILLSVLRLITTRRGHPGAMDALDFLIGTASTRHEMSSEEPQLYDISSNDGPPT